MLMQGEIIDYISNIMILNNEMKIICAAQCWYIVHYDISDYAVMI